MGIDLDISTALGPGRRAIPLTAEVERDITAADIAMLMTADCSVKPPEIKKLSERHHMVARLLAAGTTEGEVALLTGYTNSRISILKQSPAMQDLIALYSREADAEFAVVLDHMTGMSKDAILEIRERLETEPEKFSVKELREVAEMALDRTGHPRAKEVKKELNVNFANRLAAARERAKAIAAGKDVIDAEFEELNDRD